MPRNFPDVSFYSLNQITGLILPYHDYKSPAQIPDVLVTDQTLSVAPKESSRLVRLSLSKRITMAFNKCPLPTVNDQGLCQYEDIDSEIHEFHLIPACLVSFEPQRSLP